MMIYEIRLLDQTTQSFWVPVYGNSRHHADHIPINFLKKHQLSFFDFKCLLNPSFASDCLSSDSAHCQFGD